MFVDAFVIKTYTVSGSWDYAANSTLVNEVRFGYNRFDYITTSGDTAFVVPGLTTGLGAPGLPDISIGSPTGFLAQLGTWHNRPQSIAPNPYYDLQDSVSYLR